MPYLSKCSTASLLFLLAIISVGCKEEAPKQTAPPNIIYILADDLGYGDLGVYGQRKFATPNIDRLAQQGMLFTRHYAGAPVCAPSRSTLLTGLHTGHTPIRGNKEVQPEGQWPMPDSVVTLPEYLREAGYATGAFGKWGLGYPGSMGDAVNQGFDTFFGYNCQRLAHHYYIDYLRDGVDSFPLPGNVGAGRETYAPGLIHNRALDFMEAHREEPFFLFYASPIPHAEILAPVEEVASFRGKYLPEKTYAGVDEYQPEKGKWNFKRGAYASQPESHAHFVAMVTILDRQVGEIMDRLDSLGLADNTIVVFTSDNGPHQEGGADPDYFDSNGPLKGYKRDLYEGGIRVPMLVRWPGIVAPGSRTDHPSAFWDVLPTFLEVAGVDGPAGMDGLSFAPTLMGEGEQREHDYLYWEFHERGGRQALLRGDWKLVRYDVLREPAGAFELYNLADDVGEQNNLADRYPDRVNELRQLLEGARTSSPAFPFAK